VHSWFVQKHFVVDFKFCAHLVLAWVCAWHWNMVKIEKVLTQKPSQPATFSFQGSIPTPHTISLTCQELLVVGKIRDRITA